MRQPEQPTTAAAEIAIIRGDAVTLARLLKLADGALPEIAEQILAMLYRDPRLKWRLVVKSCGSSAEAMQTEILDLLRRDTAAGLRLVADLLDPPTGLRWQLVFEAQRPGNPTTDLRSYLIATIVQRPEIDDAIQAAGGKKEAAIEALKGRMSRATVYRALEKTRRPPENK